MADTGTADLGQSWIDSGDSVGLRVPSAIFPQVENVLLNPAHPDFESAVRVTSTEPFAFDPRILEKLKRP